MRTMEAVRVHHTILIQLLLSTNVPDRTTHEGHLQFYQSDFASQFGDICGIHCYWFFAEYVIFLLYCQTNNFRVLGQEVKQQLPSSRMQLILAVLINWPHLSSNDCRLQLLRSLYCVKNALCLVIILLICWSNALYENYAYLLSNICLDFFMFMRIIVSLQFY